MEKFTTQELTIEILEDVPAHKVSVVLINGKQTVMGYHQLQFLRGYAKEEDGDIDLLDGKNHPLRYTT